MLRVPVRRLSFISLLLGAMVGCCLNLFVHKSLQLLYIKDSLIPVLEFDQETEPLFQQETQSYTENITVQIRKKKDINNNDLYDEVRVLCWVMISPENHESKVLAVKETWGKRCNVLLFISSKDDTSLPSVQVNVKEERNRLWSKTRDAFRVAWDRYQNEVDWFFKADDDTYVIVENLRYFLSAFKTSEPLWFGHKLKTKETKGFFSGGAGYALSKEATRRFVSDDYLRSPLCRSDHKGAEDVEMGRCMENLNVSAMDTRDSKGRGRFFPFQPYRFYFSRKVTDYWYWKFIYYPPIMGPDCCSDSTISFHYIDHKMMRLLDFFFYQIRPYGIIDQRPATPEPPPDLNLTASPWSPDDKTSDISGIRIPNPIESLEDGDVDDDLSVQKILEDHSSFPVYDIDSSEMVDQLQTAKSEEIITPLVISRQTNMEASISKIIEDPVTVKTDITHIPIDETSAVSAMKKQADVLSRRRNSPPVATVRNRQTTEPAKIFEPMEAMVTSENAVKKENFARIKKKNFRKKFIDF